MPGTKNQIITLEIEALYNDGNGVAHKDSLLWRSKRSTMTETAWPTRTVRPFLCR